MWQCEVIGAPGSGSAAEPLGSWAAKAVSVRGYINFSEDLFWRGNAEGKIGLAQCRTDGPHIMAQLSPGNPDASFAGARDWNVRIQRVTGFGFKVEPPCPT
jgi:hypothetical protein